MIGVLLAAGQGSRLRPLTTDLPKTLLPVDQERSIADIALANFVVAGIDHVVVVTGFAAERIEQRAPEWRRRYGLDLSFVFNDRALEWNNAYSLWLAREAFASDALLVNGDTVHPPSVEATLLERGGPGVTLAVDDVKALGPEEMKVTLDGDRRLVHIDKGIDPAQADGEYIGVTLIRSGAATRLAEALEATWRRGPSLYYEDGFQQYVEWGQVVDTAAIGSVAWVEVDDHEDLRRARKMACRF